MNNLKTEAAAALGKVRMSLLPAQALYAIAEVFTEGASRYAAWDWLEHPSGYSTYIDALERHVNAFKCRDDADGKTGFLHMAHAGANVMIILTLQLRGLGVDDRQPIVENRL